jgi:hypothetical protein
MNTNYLNRVWSEKENIYMRAIEGVVQILLILCKCAYIHCLSEPSAARGISMQT